MDTFLDDLLELLDTTEGCTDNPVSNPSALKLRPDLWFIADRDGVLVAVHGSERCPAAEQAAIIAAQLAPRLADRPACHWKWSHESKEGVVLGCRLPADPAQRIIGCLTSDERMVMEGSSDLTVAQTICSLLASAASGDREASGRLQTRIDHLLAERDALKASHAEALADAIVEREHRLSEQEKHLHQQQLLHLQNQMILDSAGEGIMGLDTRGEIIFVNPAGASMLGYKVDELIGKSCRTMIHRFQPDHQPRPPADSLCWNTPDETASCSGNETLRKKDGSCLPIDYTRTCIRDNEQSVGTVLTYRDMTERRKLEAKLRQAQKMESIGQLAAGIAHEINTPTQYIGDNSRFLAEAFNDLRELLVACEDLRHLAEAAQAVDPRISRILAAVEHADLAYLTEEIPTAISQSLDGVQRVAKIVRSMKEFSHPSEDVKQAIDLNRSIENTLTVSRNEWKYVADMITDFDSQLPPVPCFPGDLNQVVLNLIINAAHAIGDATIANPERKGTIRMTTRLDGKVVEIRIADTGMGIPEAIRSRIYDPFFTTKPVGRGTGQGLAIAHAIITEKHEGTIDFETEVGRGTTFIIRLPLADAMPIRERV